MLALVAVRFELQKLGGLCPARHGHHHLPRLIRARPLGLTNIHLNQTDIRVELSKMADDDEGTIVVVDLIRWTWPVVVS